MSGTDFLDTNVVVYAYQITDIRKQKVAQDLLKSAVTGQFVISAQVLSEFAVTLLHKFSQAATPEELLAILDRLAAIRLIMPDADLIRRALEARVAYGVHFYDGMIIAAAERAGCGRILSEDFNHGQEYFGVVAANPFQ